MYRIAMAYQATCPDFHREMFGCSDFFPKLRVSGHWITFRVQDDAWSSPTCFHGCCLSELHSMPTDGVWKAGRWKTSPLAVWVASTPSAALDRASAKRGYARSLSPLGIPNGWDSPVLIAFNINIEVCGLHDTLANGVQLRRYLTGNRQIVPLRELNVVECRI